MKECTQLPHPARGQCVPAWVLASLATRAGAGKVTKILVDDGQPVEFGEPLMILE